MTSFVVDLLNGSGAALGSGPLQNVLQVSITETLDEAGQVQFTLPATDYRASSLISSAVRFRIRFDNGSLVYGLIGHDVSSVATAQPTRTVTGQDLIGELANYSCGWWCFFDTDALSTVVIPALLAGTGWSAGTFDAGMGNFYGRFDGDSRLAALIKVINQTPNIHFRMGSTLRTLDVGAFAALSSVRFTNVDHALVVQDSNSDIAIIGALQITSDRAQIVNRIIPWGAGNDSGDTYRAKVKLFQLNRGSAYWSNIKAKPGLRGVQVTVTGINEVGGHHWEVDSTTGIREAPISQLVWCDNPADLSGGYGYDFVVNDILSSTKLTVNGSPTVTPGDPTSFPTYLITDPQLYIEDETAYADDPHEAVIIFNDITLSDLSNGSWEKGALQLYGRAKRYLDTHKVAQITYTLSALRCPATVRAGDKVKIIYRGAVTRDGVAYDWINLDQELFVTKITRIYNADGSTGATLDVSNLAARPIDSAAIIYENAAQVNSINRSAG
jgi:hypothetical protein